MSAWTCRQRAGKADPKIVPPRSRIPSWKGLCADSEEKHEPASDIDTVLVDRLKALDPNRPIREADVFCIYISGETGAWCWSRGKGRSMALDTNTFLMVFAAAILGVGIAVWIMFKKVT
jgi:hypothetical protein